MNHTKEPWQLNYFLNVRGDEITTVDEVIEGLTASAIEGAPELHGGTIPEDDRVVFYTGNGPTSSANAARIVACVNACTDIPNPDAIADVVEALRGTIPTGICLTNKNIPDSMSVPLETTMGELRKVLASLAKLEEKP